MPDTHPSDSSAGTRARWEEWSTRTTAVLAVVAALASARWGASNLQAILEQGRVNDAWAYYQSKSVKQHSAEQTRDLAAALASGGPSAAGRDALDQLARQLKGSAEHEAHDKDRADHDAQAFEARRDRLVESSFWYELSFAALQLGVILCTIASAAHRRLPWIAGIVLGAAGLVLLLNGWRPLYHAPRSWYHASSDAMNYDAAKSPSGQAG